MTRSMIRPVVSQCAWWGTGTNDPVDPGQAPECGLVHGGGQPPDEILEVAGET
jgi:hypothetical protein